MDGSIEFEEVENVKNALIETEPFSQAAGSDCPLLYRIKEVQDLFLDAVVQNSEGSLVFASVIGRDTVVKQFLAQLQLGSHEGGLTAFSLTVGSSRVRRVFVNDANALQTLSGKVQTVFGEMSQVFVYSKEIQRVDKANLSAWLLFPVASQSLSESDQETVKQRCWDLVKQLAPTVVLDEWREPLMKEMPGLTQALSTDRYHPMGKISAWRIQLPAIWNQVITKLIRAGTLPIEQFGLEQPKANSNQ